MNINGVELEFDLMEAETAERVDAALVGMAEARQAVADKSLAENIRIQCAMVMDCFDRVFGEGTGRRVAGEGCNLGRCMDAFEAFAGELDRQRQAVVERTRRYGAGRLGPREQ